MSIKLKYAIFLLLLINHLSVLAQSHQWANNILTNKYFPTITAGVAMDANSNSYGVVGFIDSINISNQSVHVNSKKYAWGISKIDSRGNCHWIKPIYSRQDEVRIRGVKLINNNKILVFGYFNGPNLLLSKTDSIANPSNNNISFIATYDSLGTFIEFHIFTSDKESSIYLLDTDKRGDVVICFSIGPDSTSIKHVGGSLNIGKTNYFKMVLVKYDSNFKTVLWNKQFNVDLVGNLKNFIINVMNFGEDNNLYLGCEIHEDFTINGKTFKFSPGFDKGLIVIISSTGKFIYTDLLSKDNKQSDNVFDITAIDTNHIYILGYVRDSILRDKKWYTSPNKSSKGTAFPYIGLISITNGVKWINLTLNKDTFIYGGNRITTGFTNLKLNKNGDIYCAFLQRNKFLSIGGLTDSSNADYVLCKFDSLGSALWLRSAIFVTGLISDNNSNLVYTGRYSSHVKLPPYSLTGSAFGSGYIAKTYDYKIVRGDVKKGPYCSGDTILVPYTKIGVFDSSNHFVAELSDEYGNFNGNERELGRVKTNKDSMVIGRLPNFQVSTSDKYRIRIRATKPAVQGFYRPDTLRLLIYSRDKANPGPPITICRGDTVQLNTYGGSKWSWSPSYHINDSALRQPKVWPDTTTRYKIIISDSYGCGSPDTAFKTIVVRKDPKIIFTSSHSKICKQTQVKITARFQWGDSSAYQNRWYFIDSAFNWVPIASNALTYSDTLLFMPPSYFNDSVRVVCILNDACSPKSDTAFYSLFIKKLAPHIRIPFNDTFVCENETLAIPFKFVNVDSMQLSYQWYYISSPSSWFHLAKGNNTLSDTIYYSAAGAIEKLVLVLNDHCNFKSDTAFVTLRLRSKTKLNVAFNDTLVCYGNTLRYKAKASGGLSASYRFMWKDVARNTMLSTTDSLTLFATQTTRIKLSITDGCIAGDSTFFTLYVNPPLKASVLWDQGVFGDTALCYAQSIKLYSHGKGGNGSGYQFKWYLGNSLVSSLDTFILNTKTYFSNTSESKSLHLLLNDQCTKAADSIAYSITVKPTPLPDFAFGLTCNKTPIKFVFTGSVPASPLTSSYLWKFPDGDSSMLKDPSKLLTQTGIKNIRLKVSSNNGCSQVISKEIDVKLQAKASFIAKDVCQDSTVNFVNTSEDGLSYNWKFGDGQTAAIFSPKHLYKINSGSTTFNVRLVANVPIGCSDSITASVTVYAKPISDFNFSINGNRVDFSALQTNATKYLWSFGDGATFNSSNPTSTYTYISSPSGKYKVCLSVINSDGCNSQTCNDIVVNTLLMAVSSPNINIYPNPNTGAFNIHIGQNATKATIEIYNATGALVYNTISASSSTQINLILNKGVYWIKVYSQKTSWSRKMVVLD
jgi:hypothetical protein